MTEQDTASRKPPDEHEFKHGDVVEHRASGQRAVIIGEPDSVGRYRLDLSFAGDFCQCLPRTFKLAATQ